MKFTRSIGIISLVINLTLENRFTLVLKDIKHMLGMHNLVHFTTEFDL